MTNLTSASHEWASRPDDERYLSLEELHAAVMARKSECWTATPAVKDLRAVPSNGGMAVEVYDPSAGQRRELSRRIGPSRSCASTARRQRPTYASCLLSWRRSISNGDWNATRWPCKRRWSRLPRGGRSTQLWGASRSRWTATGQSGRRIPQKRSNCMHEKHKENHRDRCLSSRQYRPSGHRLPGARAAQVGRSPGRVGLMV